MSSALPVAVIARESEVFESEFKSRTAIVLEVTASDIVNSIAYYSYGSEESFEIKSPSQITFWSLPRILPSEKESCSLDNINKVE